MKKYLIQLILIIYLIKRYFSPCWFSDEIFSHLMYIAASSTGWYEHISNAIYAKPSECRSCCSCNSKKLHDRSSGIVKTWFKYSTVKLNTCKLTKDWKIFISSIKVNAGSIFDWLPPTSYKQAILCTMFFFLPFVISLFLECCNRICF